MANNVSPKVEAILRKAELGRDSENNPTLTSSQINDRKYKAGAKLRTAVRKVTGKSYNQLSNEERFLAMEQVFKDYAMPRIKDIGDSNMSQEDKLLSVSALEKDMQAKYPAGFEMVNYVNEQRTKAMEMAPQMLNDMAGIDPNSGYQAPQLGDNMVAGQGGPVPGSLQQGLNDGLQK